MILPLALLTVHVSDTRERRFLPLCLMEAFLLMDHRMPALMVRQAAQEYGQCLCADTYPYGSPLLNREGRDSAISSLCFTLHYYKLICSPAFCGRNAPLSLIKTNRLSPASMIISGLPSPLTSLNSRVTGVRSCPFPVRVGPS